jgi:hypothetical protein
MATATKTKDSKYYPDDPEGNAATRSGGSGPGRGRR